MKIFWIAALAVIVLSVPTARAILPPDVTFIPDQISANSSFLMIANPHATSSELPVVTRYIVFETAAYGSIPYSSNGYICYFSNTDPQSNCGPNIFTYPSFGVPYTMEVNATNKFGQVESTIINVTVGGIEITPNIAVQENKVYIYIQVTGGIVQGGISYATYDATTLTPVSGKSGKMTVFNPPISGYNTSITLPDGEYYIAFTANTGTDFGGGVSRVVVGGGSPNGSPDVSADSIAYSPVINPGQEFKIETFKITNIGTENLTGLSISVPQQISSYLTITPKQTSLGPNESTFMTVTLHNIQSSMNISTFATLLSGPTEIKQIPVELRISVIGAVNPASCVGKTDMTLCLGGICCGGACKTGGAQCCSSSDCPSGQICSSDFKCTTSGNTSECVGKSDMATCTGGICCSSSCITGGECCIDSDCSIGETCSYSNICETQPSNECTGKAEGAACSTGYCCSGYCQECCTNDDCTGGKTCSGGICTSGTVVPSGIDIITIALIGGGVVVAAVVGFFLFKKFVKKKGKEGEEEFEEGGEEKEEDEFSDEDFY